MTRFCSEVGVAAPGWGWRRCLFGISERQGRSSRAQRAALREWAGFWGGGWVAARGCCEPGHSDYAAERLFLLLFLLHLRFQC